MSTMPKPAEKAISADIPEKEILPGPSVDLANPESVLQKGLVPAGLVLLLAFFLASTPARNSDFWLHLATGKAILQGQYQIGLEPFTSGETTYWVNPSWLYDLLLYVSYQALGGTILIVLKALVAALTAGLLILSGANGKSFFLSSLCTGLVFVAMGPWLALKPLFLSLFFLAWTIWYLKKKLEGREKHLALVTFWPLLAVFALWANLDSWFFLGPVTVFFFFLGSLLPGQSRNSRSLGLLMVASLAVCLANPHLVHIFSVPYQLVFSGVPSQLEQDPFLRLMAIPFQNIYFSSLFFKTLPGLVFWMLTLGTLLSFILDYGGWPWRWFFLWAFLFLLSYIQVQAIPFFAIVCAPMLALNLGRCFSRKETSVLRNRLSRLGRAIAFLVVSVMAVAAWPGWLSLGPPGPRNWQVELDPGFRAIGEQLAQWHAQGKTLGAAYPFSPEAGNYLAWFCPEIPCPVNSHLHLSEQEAGDLLAVREGLMGTKSPGSPVRDWRAILRGRQVSFLVIHGEDQATFAAIRNLIPAYRESPLLCFKGKSVVFGWRDPRREENGKDPYAGLVTDLYQQTFGGKSQEELAAASKQDPVPLRWWDAFWRPRYSLSVDRDEAKTLLAIFDGILERQSKKLFFLGQSKLVAELVYTAMLPGPGSSNCCLQLNMLLNPYLTKPLLKGFVDEQDEGPLPALYLAVRACRRALQTNQDDVQTFFLLGETYARLRDFTRERNWGPVLGNFRTVQASAAYRFALNLNSRNWRIHQRLVELFQSMDDYKDLALQHMKELYRIRSAGPEPGEGKEEYKNRMGQLKGLIQILEKEVQDLSDRLAANSLNLRIVDRANLAGQLGLCGRALAILLNTDIAAFGAKGLEMELKLLLNTGQLDKVKKWLEPKHQDLLGYTNYLLIKAQMEAGLGNYAEAQKALHEMIMTNFPGNKKVRPIDMLALGIGNSHLFEASGGPLKMVPVPNVNFLASKDTLRELIFSGLTLMNQEAVSRVLQGTLAVEAGDNRKAEVCFRRALAFWESPAGETFQDPRSRAGRRMASYFLRQLNKTQP
jgi:hypothetical protein